MKSRAVLSLCFVVVACGGSDDKPFASDAGLGGLVDARASVKFKDTGVVMPDVASTSMTPPPSEAAPPPAEAQPSATGTAPPPPLQADAMTIPPDAAPDAAAPDAGSMCTAATDCMALHTFPSNCAVADCVGGQCVYRTRDADGDGYRDEFCRIISGPGTIETGNDCADDDSTVHPGAWDGPAGVGPGGVTEPDRCNLKDDDCDGLGDDQRTESASCVCTDGQKQTCRATSDGTPIHYPTEVPLGDWCALGTQLCQAGSWSLCTGARGPAPEICDGKDNDCNGVVDDNPTDQAYYYCDADGDGHLVASAPRVLTCRQNMTGCKGIWQPYASKEFFDDCDDSDVNDFPGNAEVCDTRDNDCDGLVDEVKEPDGGIRDLRTVYYDDADGDGYGDSSTAQKLCGKAGAVTQGGDCNDHDSKVHPSASEICNGKDDDCDPSTNEADPAAHLVDEPTSQGTTFACVDGKWVITQCPGANKDCNGNVYDACETDCSTIANCHACGKQCSFACGSSDCNEITAVAGGSDFTVALTSDGMAASWGTNEYGEVGDGTPINRYEPVAVVGIHSRVHAVAAGAAHACAIVGDSRASFCWGLNDSAQLGVTTNGAYAAAPVATFAAVGDDPSATTLVNVKSMAAGVAHTCAVRDGGGVLCWGSNAYGQMGIGYADPSTPNLVPTPCTNETLDGDMKDVVAVAVGSYHTCIIKTDQSVECWGNNQFGQVGGNDAQVPLARQVDGLSGVSELAAGDEFTCALKGHDVYCWGNDAAGQIGAAVSGSSSQSPVKVSGLPAVTTIALGARHACAIDDTQQLWCWGSNAAGQLGAPSPSSSSTPLKIAVDGSVTAVGAGWQHTCAIAGGRTYCWGSPSFGVLGRGASLQKPSSTPDVVRPLRTAD